ncbi:MAG: tRNA (adenosine(37)-N6)-threonylcarbamoyltransferase complex transferase subunit TsaD [Patescibacteria group bacterium]
MIILAIETSCDETAAAVVEYSHGSFAVHSNVVSSQIEIHKKFGGVVPEVAARKQVELIIPVIEEALAKAYEELGIKNQELGTTRGTIIHNSRFIIPHLDALAVTVGPGLQIALSVGVETARTLAAVWKKPIVAVNHLEGHLYSALLPATQNQTQNSKLKTQNYGINDIYFPAIGLMVSGGHTELILIKDFLKYTLLGRTRDDAAGEAFDKVAKLLGLPYPGGPAIDRLARLGDPQAFDFPRGMIKSGDYDFSFSGLKTAVLYTLQCHPELVSESRNKKQKKHSRTHDPQLPTSNFHIPTSTLKDLCASFQAAVVDVLVEKTIRAAKQHNAKTVLLGGGVAANSQLRRQLAAAISIQLPHARYLIPATSYTTDNAAMIAAAAVFHVQKRDFTPWQQLRADLSLYSWHDE